MGTTWIPQTCPAPQCNFSFTTDVTMPAAVRFESLGRLCSAHAGMTGTAHFAAAVDECGRRNEVERIAAQLISNYDAEKFTWSFNLLRIILVSYQGASANVKTQMQNAADLQFGPGKVLVS